MASLSIDTDALDEGARTLRALVEQLGYHGPQDVSTCGSAMVSSHVADRAHWLETTGVAMAMKVSQLADGASHVADSFVGAETRLESDARAGFLDQ